MRPFRLFAALLLVSGLAGVSPVAAGGGCHVQGINSERGNEVRLTKNCFFPTVLHVAAGTTVRWTNEDGFEHTITAAGRLFDRTVNGVTSHEFRFDSAGVYPYYCMLHPGMAGAVVVGDTAAEVAAAPVSVTRPQSSKKSTAGVSGGAAAAIAAIAAVGGFGVGRVRRRAEKGVAS